MYLLEFALVCTLLLAGTFAVMSTRRMRVYSGLRRQIDAILQVQDSRNTIEIASRPLPSFDDALAVLPNAIPLDRLAAVAAEIDALRSTERSYLPTHKKGGTVAYETLCTAAPQVVALYQSKHLHQLISRIVGVDVVPTPLHDQSSCSVLFYERPGDHIGWHYDHNFYRGRHFTVLLPIINRDSRGQGVSAARLMAKVGGVEREIPTPPNQLVVFEGARVLHKATPITEGERRIVLSMTFATDPGSTIVQGVARRIKDTAFFGIRALWT